MLIVEDDYFLADIMRRTFADDGAEVLGPAGQVENALALIHGAEHIDAAVLDVNLHDVMVFSVADALRERGIPFLFTTGYDQETLPSQYSGARRLEKPVEAAIVLSEVRRLINIDSVSE
ncbi:response regulator [Methylobacterium komagatae]|uniref:response regulator n=1 Tax=Methylobacterium komagatae TaxID=374425 RepID=UPI00366DFF8C